EAFLKDGDIIRGGRTRLRLTVPAATEPVAVPDLTCVACGAKIAAAGLSSTDFEGPPSNYLCATCRRRVRGQPQPVPGSEIVRPLGEGSLGVVYLARHGGTGQPVTLKLVVPEPSAGHRSVHAFLKEVNVLRKLEHPRIVHLREAGVTQGQFFF